MSFKPSLSKEMSSELSKCFRCGFCRSQCPVYQSKLNDTWNARGRMMAVQLLREGKISLDEGVLDRIYTCALCKACEEICPGLVKVSDIIKEVRCQLAEVKKGPLPDHLKMFENIATTKNVLAMKTRSPELQEAIDRLPQRAETILFMGCVAQYVYPKHLLTLFKLLEQSKTEFTVLRDEVCCGSYLADLGLAKEAREVLAETGKMLKERDVHKIVTLCPMCYNTLRNDLPELMSTPKIEVQHSTQLLDEALRKGSLTTSRALPMKLVYKDPCHLGRHAQVYDEPRNILRNIKGAELLELDRSREFSRCCGGTIRVPYSDLRNDLCKKFFDEAVKLRVDGVVTACPSCFHNLYSTAPYDIKGIFDIVEILGYATGIVEKIPFYEY
jgi:Fe-S oxidoreductase